MEKGVIEFGKSLLEPVAEDRKDFLTPLEFKLDSELNYPSLTIAEKIEVLEKLVKELQGTQAIKDFVELSNDPRYQERIRSIQAKIKDSNIITHHLHKAQTEIRAFKNLKLHRFKFDIERIYIYNGRNVFAVPSTLIRKIIVSQTEEVNNFLDKIEDEAKEPLNFNPVNELEPFSKYLQKNFKTYAELFAKNKAISTVREPTFDKIKADFSTIITILATTPQLTSTIKCDL